MGVTLIAELQTERLCRSYHSISLALYLRQVFSTITVHVKLRIDVHAKKITGPQKPRFYKYSWHLKSNPSTCIMHIEHLIVLLLECINATWYHKTAFVASVPVFQCPLSSPSSSSSEYHNLCQWWVSADLQHWDIPATVITIFSSGLVQCSVVPSMC